MVKRINQQQPVEMIDLYEQQNNIKLSTTLIRSNLGGQTEYFTK